MEITTDQGDWRTNITAAGDTHTQSAPVFGLAYLLGINLMSRIRNLKKLVFFKPDRGTRYEYINGLFRHSAKSGSYFAHVPWIRIFSCAG
jgi:TnpA family transposase